MAISSTMLFCTAFNVLGDQWCLDIRRGALACPRKTYAMSTRPSRERKQVTSFLQEVLNSERRIAEAKQRKKEEEEERKRKQELEEGPLIAEFARAKKIANLLQEEEALVHANKLREARYRIKEDSQKSSQLQNEFLANRFVHPLLVAAMYNFREQMASRRCEFTSLP